MGWFANLKIGTKLRTGFTLIILISLIMTLAGIMGMGKIDRLLAQIDRISMPHIVIANEISTNLLLHNRRSMRHILSSGQDMEHIRSRMKINEQAVASLLEKFTRLDVDIAEQRLLHRFKRTWSDYLTVVGQVTQYSHAGSKDTALRLDEREVEGHFHELENILDELIRYNIAEGKQLDEEAEKLFHTLRGSLTALMLFAIIISLLVAWGITRSIINPLSLVLDTLVDLSRGVEDKALLAATIASGDLSRQVQITPPLTPPAERFTRDEAGVLLRTVADMSSLQSRLDQALADMTAALRRSRDEDEARDWIKTGINNLNSLTSGDRLLQDLVNESLAYLCSTMSAAAGAFYLWNDRGGKLEVTASYMIEQQDMHARTFKPGEGVAGQAAQLRRLLVLTDVPAGYMTISSALGKANPLTIAALPLIHDKRLVGAIEIASFRPFGSRELELLKQAQYVLASGVGVTISRRLVDELLEQTQSQTEELRVQQEQLQQSNEELEERAQMLEQQREQIRAKNREVEETSQELQLKADELERISTYKSEFLANMSHELRTPLNSLMILSRMLMDNKEGNLTARQVDFARTMNDAGNDLLSLINDILDLSKVEAGRLDFHYDDAPLKEMLGPLETMFMPLAEQKGIIFRMIVSEDAPQVITADIQRTQQILKNLLSNAFKFTTHGEITVRAEKVHSYENPLPVPSVAIAVTDNGIGIPQEKQEMVFHAFQQGDGSTSRKFGGTGLGLSISRQLARAMHGEIQLSSQEEQGSIFTLYLPLAQTGVSAQSAPPPPAMPPAADSHQPVRLRHVEQRPPLPAAKDSKPPDERDQPSPGRKSILIIEDDQNFASILMEMVRERGFAPLAAQDGETGIYMADRYLPDAIILDVMLPHVDGWGVMNLLKENPRTRHIPVHFLTCLEDRQKAMAMGAIGFVTKPVDPEQMAEVFSTIETAISRSVKRLLIVEDDQAEARSMVALLEGRDVAITVAGSGKEATELLSRERFDCMVLDLGLSDMSGFDLLEHIQQLDEKVRLPVIIHSGKSLSHDEELKLRHYTESIIIKGAKSPERLLNEVTLFLHQVENSLNPDKQRMLRASLDKETMLEGKKVLLVDDDMRNIFSLTSILADKNMKVVEAENGREALLRLEENPDVDLVLMDIMMPEMDGYETIRTIRKDVRFRHLSIIAMTAKALKGDQEKCLQAGASDYISKPIDVEKLLSLMRVWLYQQR